MGTFTSQSAVMHQALQHQQRDITLYRPGLLLLTLHRRPPSLRPSLQAARHPQRHPLCPQGMRAAALPSATRCLPVLLLLLLRLARAS